MADELQTPFDRSVVHDYRHWTTGESCDMEYEIAEIQKITVGLEPYVVFAKSIGTMITLQALYEQKIHPEACLLLGLPLKVQKDMGLPLATWLSAVNIPITYVQNKHDPYGGAAEVAAILRSHSNINPRLTVLPGDTHDYMDTQVMAEQLANLTTAAN